MNIFVYGTLWRYLKTIICYQVVNYLALLIESIKNNTIKDELYKIAEYVLEQLNILEAYTNFYIKKEVTIKLDGRLKKLLCI